MESVEDRLASLQADPELYDMEMLQDMKQGLLAKSGALTDDNVEEHNAVCKRIKELSEAFDDASFEELKADIREKTEYNTTQGFNKTQEELQAMAQGHIDFVTEMYSEKNIDENITCEYIRPYADAVQIQQLAKRKGEDFNHLMSYIDKYKRVPQSDIRGMGSIRTYERVLKAKSLQDIINICDEIMEEFSDR
ncbi:unnamed protein product [Cylicocyclus nassatus]|uniref:Uncharacterized protein n=1 Tax=Cylicocyclus nassatus TaxID=53992 RepID=A0AA36GI08_CYLNA|nr:unnamed protein product [Cylicocyclus nassatus]